MSDYQHKEGFGSLFKNRYKEKENQPDMKGDAMYNGQEVELAAWTKTDKNGGKFLSIAIKDRQEQYKQGIDAAKMEAKPSPADTFEDIDIPF